MHKLHKLPKFIFLYIQLRYDLWKYERELRKDHISFDPSDFIKNNELVQETKELWSKKTGREISDSEAIEIIRNFSNLILFLKGEKK